MSEINNVIGMEELSIYDAFIKHYINENSNSDESDTDNGYIKELVYDSGSDTNYAPVSTAPNNLDVDVSFNQDISKFDQLMLIFSAVNDGSYTISGRFVFYDVDLLLNSNKAYDYSDYHQRWLRLKVKNPTTFSYYSQAAGENNEAYRPRIFKIYGIKYGGGAALLPEYETIPDYSTTEYKTGRKWIDGRDVYECILPFTLNGVMDSAWTKINNNNYTHTNYPSGIISQILTINVIRNQSDGYQTRLGGGTTLSEYNPITGMFWFNIPQNYSSWIILQYTKNTN